ncbi:monomeric thiosulfate reductase apoprotein [Desulfatibacillum aliphaticivorans]|uniref:Monomeric thiosulfate reductase apoprotein n=1 Tax=Desulfatibacillum aliphaticivorans TaxID=218208 RepID=B8F982_DESAL|nr:molybdopterin-dependent oxidoreductase [Desulfatibacillum aliphaticivorans]ACL02828.1 monomeric thiosulfate reductase apoprotein [Desulfatibacillum aliphaticivorans]
MTESLKTTYSICGMCTVRCPIKVETEHGRVRFIQGNPNFSSMKGVCPRGVAGKALVEDDERPQSPLIRVGERGSGHWKAVSWDEALDYIANKMKGVIEKYGARAVSLSDRGGPFRDMHRAFLRGLGTPNYCNHDASCARNVQHAALSVTGQGRKAVEYDLKNAKHVVLQSRNMFEAVNVQEVGDLVDAMDKGCRLTVIDIRANVSSTKANRFFMVRPGTDYALNLSVIHELLKEGIYDKDFASKHIQDLDALEQFVKPYTPDWAAKECGVSAESIRAFARELADAAPSVIWHPGWMTARYKDSFQVSRTAYIINALLGSYGAKGGLPFVNKPGDMGVRSLKKFMDLYPSPKDERVDGAGWRLPHIEKGPGLTHLLFKAMETEDPYPVKAYIAWRHDPLMGLPDPDRLQERFNNLDLMVSVTFSWSDTAWHSDVVLPLSTYLERESIIAAKNALQPYFFLRQRAMEPRFDSKADWEIVSGLAKRLDLPELVFDSVEDVWAFQLKDTGYTIDDFKETGRILFADKPVYKAQEDIAFKTPSKKIEIISQKLEDAGIQSLKPYESPQHPPEGAFRLTFGRVATHTQGHTANNTALSELMPENVLWIHSGPAEALGIEDGATVNVANNGAQESIKARVTDCIHPEAVFMVHGFGHRLKVESRALGKGAADNRLMTGGLDNWDRAGGAVAMQEHFVTVTPA